MLYAKKCAKSENQTPKIALNNCAKTCKESLDKKMKKAYYEIRDI